MPKTSRFPALLVCVLAALLAPVLAAQTATTIAAGTSFATERDALVSGVRVEVQPDGAVWFLLPALDRIAVLRDGVTTQWQIRDDTHLGANPVDFELDGDIVWYLCNGESGIDAGHSIFGRLDTVTGEIREWEVPGGRPAGFYRSPDGKVWIPQTNQKLQSVDLETLEVVDYRSTATIAFSDIVLGPDGALWMTDFGNNRIVRYEPGALQETYWTIVDPTLAIFNPSQIKFDAQGRLWICEFSGGRIERFDPSTGELVTFAGFLNPIHFDLFGSRVYVAEANGSNGQIAVLDPRIALGSALTLEPQTADVGRLVNTREAVVHDQTAIQTTFTSPPEEIPAADLVINVGAGGILRTQLPWTNAYGIQVVGGEVWVGSAGNLAHLVLQTIGGPTDLVAPAATQLAGAAEVESRIDVVLYNPSDTTIAGDLLYLFSPGFFAARATFTLAPGQTLLLPDAFGDLGSATVPFVGPVRILVTSGPADRLVATVRSAKARADGGAFGYLVPASPVSEALGVGSSRTLFTGARESDESAFGFYTPSGAEAVFTLVAPDGTVRGTIPISITSNIAEEFSPAASAFGLSAEPGDVIRVEVVSGALYAYVRIVDSGTDDVALSVPAKAAADAVFPNAGTAVGLFGTSFVSDLYLSNPAASEAHVQVSYYPLGSAAPPSTVPLTLPPGGSSVTANVLETLFGVPVGQGSLLVESDVPVASSLRVAAVKEEGDFSTLALPIEPDGVVSSGDDAFVIGELQTTTRRTNVLLFNRGAAGVVTLIAYNGNNVEIGRLQVPVGSNRSARADSLLPRMGVAEERNGRIVLQASEGMVLYAWAAGIDGPTGDVEIVPFR